MNRPTRDRPRNIGELRHQWVALSIYQRFETAVAIVLTLVIGAVIAVALYRLIVSVIETLVLESLNPLDHEVFQAVFGEIMTLLIALEFNHTLHYAVSGDRGIIHTRMVILIAILALARKIVITNLFAAPPVATVALATLMIALGVTYSLMREPDDRLTGAGPDE